MIPIGSEYIEQCPFEQDRNTSAKSGLLCMIIPRKMGSVELTITINYFIAFFLGTAFEHPSMSSATPMVQVCLFFYFTSFLFPLNCLAANPFSYPNAAHFLAFFSFSFLRQFDKLRIRLQSFV